MTRADIVVGVVFGLWIFLLSLLVFGGLALFTVVNLGAHL